MCSYWDPWTLSQWPRRPLRAPLPNPGTPSVHPPPQHHDDPEEAGVKWHFLPTPPMSTYLLAFVVGDLASVTRTLPGGRNVSVWGTPDR